MTDAHWAPDPTGRHDLRLWDGRRWSDRVADAGVARLDSGPLPLFAPAPEPTPDAPALRPTPVSAGAAPAGTPEHREWPRHLLLGVLTAGLWGVVGPAVPLVPPAVLADRHRVAVGVGLRRRHRRRPHPGGHADRRPGRSPSRRGVPLPRAPGHDEGTGRRPDSPDAQRDRDGRRREPDDDVAVVHGDPHRQPHRARHPGRGTHDDASPQDDVPTHQDEARAAAVAASTAHADGGHSRRHRARTAARPAVPELRAGTGQRVRPLPPRHRSRVPVVPGQGRRRSRLRARTPRRLSPPAPHLRRISPAGAASGRPRRRSPTSTGTR